MEMLKSLKLTKVVIIKGNLHVFWLTSGILMKFSYETYDKVKSHKKAGLHDFSSKYIF